MADRNRSFSLVEESRALMVVASSLQVYSAFRLVKRAKELKIPVAILNLGETRADQLADLKIDLACNPLLSEVVNEMNRM